MPIRPNFYWYTRPEPENDLRRLLDGFETKAQAEERAGRLCRTLEVGDREHQRLAERLRRCGKGRRCCLVPCPRCRRRWRLWLVGEMLRLWKGRKDLSFVTLIPPDVRLPQGELEGFRPRRLSERVKRQWQRAGLGEILVMGGVDMSWEEDGSGEGEGVWQPHLHMIVGGCSGSAIKKVLARHWPPTAEVPRPLKVQSVKEAVRQFSYCIKPFWVRRVSWTGAESKRRTRRVGLKMEQQRTVAMFGSKLRPSELLLLCGMRQRGARLVIES